MADSRASSHASLSQLLAAEAPEQPAEEAAALAARRNDESVRVKGRSGCAGGCGSCCGAEPLSACGGAQRTATQLAAAAPSHSRPNPTLEANKFVLLPHWDQEYTDTAYDDDPHNVPLFGQHAHALPYGQVIERNPLPELEPPYVQKPFLGRANDLSKLVQHLSRRRQ